MAGIGSGIGSGIGFDAGIDGRGVLRAEVRGAGSRCPESLAASVPCPASLGSGSLLQATSPKSLARKRDLGRKALSVASAPRGAAPLTCPDALIIENRRLGPASAPSMPPPGA